MYNKIRLQIRNIISESLDELSSTKATSLLNIVAIYLPDKINHYKNIIFKKSLKDAVDEFSKELNKNSENINKIISKGYFAKTGNPLGINGSERKIKESNILFPELIDLNTYIDKADNLKRDVSIKDSDMKTLHSFFTPETFDMINKAISKLTERHNKQVEQIKGGNLDNLLDPYTNQAINLNDESTVERLGAYYQSTSTYTKSHQLHDANRIIQTALNKKTISGLRWLVNNAKNIE